MKDHIAPAAEVVTDQWIGYGPVAKDFPNMVQIPSGKKGANFPELHRTIMMLKAWLRGIHHHVEDLHFNAGEERYHLAVKIDTIHFGFMVIFHGESIYYLFSFFSYFPQYFYV